MSQDGGYAWVVCAASFLAQVMIGGFVYCSGIFYIMFKNGIDASDSALSLITSLNFGTMMIVCPAVGMLTERYGERRIAILGAFLSTAGLATSAFTTQVYQLYICYSVFAGVGMGMNFNPCILILSKYFNRHRRMACACATCGLGAGSFIMPPLLEALEEYYGWRGAILLIAGIYSHNMVLCCTFRPVAEQEKQDKDTRHAEEEEADGYKVLLKVVLAENGQKVPLNGPVTSDANEPLAPHNGNNKSSSSAKLFKSGSLNISNDSSDSLFTSHIDMGVFYKNYSDEDILHMTPSDELNNCPIEVQDLHKSSGDGKCLSKNFSDIDISTEDPEVSDTFTYSLLSLFRIIPFFCILLFTFIEQFTIAIVYTHFGNYVLTLGFSRGEVVRLYMAMGVTSTVSRPIFGILLQATNANAAAVILFTNVVNGILTAALPLSTNLALLYMYAMVFCVLICPYNILASAYIMETVPMALASTAFGILCSVCTPGAILGAPLAAWLYDYTNIYDSSFYLAGGLMVMAGLTMSHPAYSVYKHKRALSKGDESLTSPAKKLEPH